MSGWTEQKKGSVKIIHHSTSSTIEIQVTSIEPVDWGKEESVTYRLWLNYEEFKCLKKVVNSVDFP